MYFYLIKNPTLLSVEKDVEWSIRDLMYRNFYYDATVESADIITALQQNYPEHRNVHANDLSRCTEMIMPRLVRGGILTLADDGTGKLYKVSALPNRYQCMDCNQISYVGEKEELKCFSCDSVKLRERNVH
jgi:hypothetical protein